MVDGVMNALRVEMASSFPAFLAIQGGLIFTIDRIWQQMLQLITVLLERFANSDCEIKSKTKELGCKINNIYKTTSQIIMQRTTLPCLQY